MVDIRPNVLPSAILPLRTGDAVIVDQGADGVRQTNPISFTDSVAPVATQAESQAGTDNIKRMTPLRTKQSIASEVGISIASNAQGSKADSAVQSVNGKIGNSVTIVKGDIGLGNVDNTSDANKPISTATQNALDTKANSSVTISAGAGLDGGGNLADNRTVSLNAASIASLAKADSSVQTVNGASPVAGNVTVAAEEKRLQDTRTTAIAESFGSNVLFVETSGYSSVGDGGGALYKRVSSEPSHAGKFQSADGAWWEIVPDGMISIKSFGSKVDATTDDATNINAALNSNLPIYLDSGSSVISSKITADNTVYTGDIDPSSPVNRGRVLKGLGARRSALLSTVSGGVAVDVIYDVGTKSHTQESFGGFSIIGYNTSDGIKIKNAAFLNWKETYITGFSIGLTLESVLSSKFEDMRISWNDYGVSAIKGTGFSQPNALTYQQCVFSNNSQMGYSGGTAHANVSFISGSFEGNGTHGVNGTGGCFINFNGGSEGSVGANFHGVYFEGNGGDADLVLNNTGEDYITVNVIGCNFNRVGTEKFVSTNIKAVGKIILNLMGCTFKGYNGYVEDSLRPYITKSDDVRLNVTGCEFDDPVAADGLNSYGGKGRYRGAVASTGIARQLPKGWTSSRDSDGVYTITHNLDTVTIYDYSVVATSNTTGVKIERTVKGGNIFQVVTVNNAGTQTDGDFEFILDYG